MLIYILVLPHTMQPQLPTNSRLVFVRHANTDKATPDEARQLTETGRHQAFKTGQKTGRIFSKVITSSVPRTQQTARLIASDDDLTLTPLDILYRTPGDEAWTILNKMFAELGNAPLSAYHAHEYWHVLQEFGKVAAEAILAEVADLENGSDILVVSHAVLTPAFVYELFAGANPAEQNVRDTVYETVLGECGFIEVTIGDTLDDITITVTTE